MLGFAGHVRVGARALAFSTYLLVAAFAPAAAQGTVAVSGTVTSSDGTPVAGAHVTLTAPGRTLRAVSGAGGRFTLSGAPGSYEITVSAKGYQTIAQRTVDIDSAGATWSFVLSRTTNNSLAVIGEVHAVGGGEALSTSSAPAVTVSAQKAAARGVTTVAGMLWNLPSVTPSLPLGGGGNATVTFALRGPDPTETLVDIDGHQVNNGGPGDFDLSLLDPADLSSVQVVYGIAPSSLIGPNTLGGAINVVTLEPTTTPHVLARAFGGSYASFGETLQTTGTSGALGYALSLHRATSSGSVNGPVVDAATAGTPNVGSAFDGSSFLSKFRFSIPGGGYVQANFRDQTTYKDLSALLSSYPAAGFTPGGDSVVRPDAGPVLTSFAGTTLRAHNAGYGFDASLPVGPNDDSNVALTTIQFSHLTSLSAQSIDGPGTDTSPYLYSNRDLIGDDWVQIDHRLPKGMLSLKADVLTESLLTNFVPGLGHDDAIHVPVGRVLSPLDNPAPEPEATTIPLAQTQRSIVLRYNGDPSNQWHYSLATYFSNFSTFGSSFDPRAGIVWTPNAATAVRASLGTTFQSPQLTELFVPPALPPPVNGLVSVGNPHLQPDHATEYQLGWERLFGAPGGQSRVSVDWYRTNLRTPITTFVPANFDPGCVKNCPLTYPINVGDGVYTGVDVKAEQQIGRDFKVSASWDVDSSYLTVTLPQSSVLSHQQSLGQPLHKASLGFARDVAAGWAYSADINYEGTYNELNRAPFATIDASLAYRWKGFEVGVYGTNLTGTYDNPYTVAGGGIPYGATDGVVPTNAYVLQGPKIVLVMTSRL